MVLPCEPNMLTRLPPEAQRALKVLGTIANPPCMTHVADVTVHVLPASQQVGPAKSAKWLASCGVATRTGKGLGLWLNHSQGLLGSSTAASNKLPTHGAPNRFLGISVGQVLHVLHSFQVTQEWHPQAFGLWRRGSSSVRKQQGSPTQSL